MENFLSFNQSLPFDFREQRAMIVPAVLMVGVGLLDVFRRFLFDYRLLTDDGAFFLHGGWYMSTGARLYLDIWDINPPVPFEIGALLSFLTGGNTWAIYWLAVLTSILLGAGTVYLISALVHEMTGDKVAAFWAGLAILVVPGFHWNASAGIHPKYLVMFLGLLALFLAMRSRPFLSGVCIAVATLSWQLGVAFLPLALGLLLQHDREHWFKQVTRYVLGGIFATILVLLPVIVLSGIRPFLVETVVVPLKLSDPVRISNAGKILTLLGLASVPISLGVIGALLYDKREGWWVLAGGGIFLFQLIAMDFDGRRDMYVGLLFAAIGFGLLVTKIQRVRLENILKITVAILLLVSIGPLGGFGIVDYAVTDENQAHPPHPLVQTTIYSVGELIGVSGHSYEPVPAREEVSEQELFWNKVKPEHCHYKMSRTEIRWMEFADSTIDECGRAPLA